MRNLFELGCNIPGPKKEKLNKKLANSKGLNETNRVATNDTVIVRLPKRVPGSLKQKS
jgi:hypothetical protein